LEEFVKTRRRKPLKLFELHLFVEGLSLPPKGEWTAEVRPYGSVDWTSCKIKIDRTLDILDREIDASLVEVKPLQQVH